MQRRNEVCSSRQALLPFRSGNAEIAKLLGRTPQQSIRYWTRLLNVRGETSFYANLFAPQSCAALATMKWLSSKKPLDVRGSPKSNFWFLRRVQPLCAAVISKANQKWSLTTRLQPPPKACRQPANQGQRGVEAGILALKIVDSS